MRPNDKRRIVITGGIATGKSQVSNYLLEKNYDLIDADKIAREVVLPQSIGLKKIAQVFGEEFVLEGELNRGLLAQAVFHDSNKRVKLNDIIHPLIFGRMKELDKAFEGPLVFFDIPLYFELREAFLEQGFSPDEVWLVYTPLSLRLERLMRRDGISREYALEKIYSQMELEEKKSMADEILFNDGDLDKLFSQVDALLELKGDKRE